MKMQLNKGAWARAVNGGKVTRKMKVSLTRLVCTNFSLLQLPLFGDNNVSLLLV